MHTPTGLLAPSAYSKSHPAGLHAPSAYSQSHPTGLHAPSAEVSHTLQDSTLLQQTACHTPTGLHAPSAYSLSHPAGLHAPSEDNLSHPTGLHALSAVSHTLQDCTPLQQKSVTPYRTARSFSRSQSHPTGLHAPSAEVSHTLQDCTLLQHTASHTPATGLKAPSSYSQSQSFKRTTWRDWYTRFLRNFMFL